MTIKITTNVIYGQHVSTSADLRMALLDSDDRVQIILLQ